MTTSLLNVLVSSAIDLSRATASFLLASSKLLEAYPDRASDVDWLLKNLETWRSSRDSIRSFVERSSELRLDKPEDYITTLERRLASMALSLPARSRGARRPDVLAITAALMSNPAEDHTFSIARYAIVCALRSLYGITNERASLEDLRDAYDRFARRLEDQQRRRVRKHSQGAESFLVDLLCLDGHAYRATTNENLTAYWQEFLVRPLGVDAQRKIRHFAERGRWPEIHGRQPDFSTIITQAFNQPTGVPGLDDVIGGFVPTMAGAKGLQPGGVVTLLAGPPGSGKTTLAMSIAARMAELGSQVAYISAEEGQLSLESKRISVVDSNSLARVMWPDADADADRQVDMTFFESGTLRSLEEVIASIKASVTAKPRINAPGQIFADFEYVVVLDSITQLLQEEERLLRDDGNPGLRERIVETLNYLRAAGVCVILIGERDHAGDSKLTYLVDNAFILDFEEESSGRHPLRILSVEKTRLQISFRGRHVMHLSRFNGVSVSPSLHAVLRMTGPEVRETGTVENRAVLWVRPSQQATLPGIEPGARDQESFTLRADSHTLIYGWGTSGKARLAMSIATEPQVGVKELELYVSDRSLHRRATQRERDWLMRSRTLVVSFLYGKAYYEQIADELSRYRGGGIARSKPDRLTVEALYPGYLDPETLVRRVKARLQGARREGRPYTGVVLDGIHNMLLQYPLLTRDPLLWPTLFRLFRRERVLAVSTFTFFEVGGGPEDVNRHLPQNVERMFHHMLVSSCDYALMVEKAPESRRPAAARVTRTTTHEGYGRERERLTWDREKLEFLDE